MKKRVTETLVFFLNPPDFAECTALPIEKVMAGIASGAIPTLEIGGSVIIPRQFVDDLVDRAMRLRVRDSMAREVAKHLGTEAQRANGAPQD
jgi:hypothetical protein